MQNAYFDTPFAARLARVDLAAVMAHVAEDTGWDETTLARAEDLYRKYLTLIALYPGKELAPPRIVDTVWHTHITFTRHYMADCELLFGTYLHHEPKDQEPTTAYAETISAYQVVFGINPLNCGLDASLTLAGWCSP